MRARLCLLAVVLPAISYAAPWDMVRVLKAPSPAVLRLPFDAPGCYASGYALGSKGEAVTFTRATAAYTFVSSAEQLCGTGLIRVADKGLLSEMLRTQYHPSSTAPAAGTTASLSASAYVFAVEGSGSQAASFGTATGTGLPCTATQAAPCSFTVSGAGTVTVAAVTGSLTRAQIEQGYARSSQIWGASRQFDLANGPVSMPVGPLCVAMTAEPYGASPWNLAAAEFRMLFGAPTGANMIQGYAQGQYVFFDIRDASNAQRLLRCDVPYLGNVAHEFKFATDNAGSMRVAIDGVEPPCSVTTATGNAIRSAAPTTLRFGSNYGGSALQGYVRHAVVAKTSEFSRCASREQWSVTPNPNTIAALGDSITQGNTAGVTTPWPAVLQTTLGGSWLATNAGYSGETATNQIARYGAGLRRQGHGSLVVLLGINDLKADATAASVWSGLNSMLEQARVEGRRVVPVTLLPWKGYASWTQPREDQRLALNASILAWCTATGSTCVDAAADMDDGTGTLKAAYDSGDHHHPNQAGHDRLATLVRAAFP
jgi:lysophospholipase L1-like esterase